MHPCVLVGSLVAAVLCFFLFQNVAIDGLLLAVGSVRAQVAVHPSSTVLYHYIIVSNVKSELFFYTKLFIYYNIYK